MGICEAVPHGASSSGLADELLTPRSRSEKNAALGPNCNSCTSGSVSMAESIQVARLFSMFIRPFRRLFQATTSAGVFTSAVRTLLHPEGFRCLHSPSANLAFNGAQRRSPDQISEQLYVKVVLSARNLPVKHKCVQICNARIRSRNCRIYPPSDKPKICWEGCKGKKITRLRCPLEDPKGLIDPFPGAAPTCVHGKQFPHASKTRENHRCFVSALIEVQSMTVAPSPPYNET